MIIVILVMLMLLSILSLIAWSINNNLRRLDYRAQFKADMAYMRLMTSSNSYSYSSTSTSTTPYEYESLTYPTKKIDVPSCELNIYEEYPHWDFIKHPCPTYGQLQGYQ